MSNRMLNAVLIFFAFFIAAILFELNFSSRSKNKRLDIFVENKFTELCSKENRFSCFNRNISIIFEDGNLLTPHQILSYQADSFKKVNRANINELKEYERGSQIILDYVRSYVVAANKIHFFHFIIKPVIGVLNKRELERLQETLRETREIIKMGGVK